MKNTNFKAFTLVELIVVITILAILGTIAFISIQSYTVYARDSVRLSNLRTIESSLKIQYTQGGAYAVPDDSVNITASGTVIRKQGVFGKQALRTVKLNSDASEDPLTGESYDYIVDNNLSEYQLVGYMEGDEAYNNTLQAETFANTGSTLKTLGQDLGIVFSGGVAVHRERANVGNNIDIMNPTGNLNIVFDEGDETGYLTGSQLFSRVYNRSKALLKNKELAKLDESLVLYFDMETTTMSGSLKVLKDFSMYGNNGVCMNGVSELPCGDAGGPLFQGKIHKIYGDSLYFDGKGANIKMNWKNDLLNIGMGEIFIGGIVYIDGSNVFFEGEGGIFSVQGNGVYPYDDAISIGLRSSYYIRNLLRDTTSNESDFLTKEKFNVGSYNYFGFTRDGNKVGNYINGIEGTYSLTTNNADVTPLIGDYESYLGCTSYCNRKFNGNIDEVRIYNRALSEKEIKTIYGSTIN